LDVLDEANSSSIEIESTDKVAFEVMSGVQEVAESLKQVILRDISELEARKLPLLAFFLDHLSSISSGNVLSMTDRLSSNKVTSQQKLASMHLQQFHNLVTEIGALLWQRRVSLESSDRKIKFALGDVVEHKHFGFRGVVVGWDSKPTVDVSRWDGLQHIKDPHTYPFYHVIADQNDCIQAFGGERPSRYVCQENLEICRPERRNIDVDLEPVWNRSGGNYIPPADLKVSGVTDTQVRIWLDLV
jgi:hemimethylated DNA binding protein